jgi:coenzyme F420-0:L-glutamate ligase/coenzyme F420-1:gamma-L-glutamate ligase
MAEDHAPDLQVEHAVPTALTLQPLAGVPEVRPGDDLVDIVLTSARATGCSFQDRDVLVIAQKIVSKAEDRMVFLDEVTPSPRARDLATKVDKDPRLVELILGESIGVLRHRPGVLVVEHRSGVVLANAGIDASNVPSEDGRERVLLLPEDADRSCADLRRDLTARASVDVAVIVNDSVGRAWRLGTVGIALGASGLSALVDLRGQTDRDGRPLQVSEVAVADELAAAASLMMGQGNQGTPIVLARGVAFGTALGNAHDLLRPADLDLFR